MEQAGALKAKGVELIACLAVNDVFVMSEWGKAHGAQGKVSHGESGARPLGPRARGVKGG